MRKVIVLLFVISLAMGAGLAQAGKASQSERGSLFFLPKIDTLEIGDLGGVDQFRETYIKIANDANQPVDVKCQWVKVDGELPIFLLDPACIPLIGKLPPVQTTTDFTLQLTKNQPVMFAASTGESAPGDPRPVTAQGFGQGNVGYLVCWAVDKNEAQINWNFLNAEAIVISPETDAPVAPGFAYEYSAFQFKALKGAVGSVVGAKGEIKFDGVNFDGMPLYLIFIVPAQSPDVPDTFKNLELTLVQGSQNFLTMSSKHHVTRAAIALWNENETPFSGIGVCTWCWLDTFLTGTGSRIANNANFTVAGMGSSVGKFRVQGNDSAGCAPSLTAHQKEFCVPEGTEFIHYATGLLGIGVQSYWTGDYVTVNNPFVGPGIFTDVIHY